MKTIKIDSGQIDIFFLTKIKLKLNKLKNELKLLGSANLINFKISISMILQISSKKMYESEF